MLLQISGPQPPLCSLVEDAQMTDMSPAQSILVVRKTQAPISTCPYGKVAKPIHKPGTAPLKYLTMIIPLHFLMTQSKYMYKDLMLDDIMSSLHSLASMSIHMYKGMTS